MATTHSRFASPSQHSTYGDDVATLAIPNALSAGTAAPFPSIYEAATGCFPSFDLSSNEVAAGWNQAADRPARPFKLGQNYPNPSRGETTVPFTLATAADVRLDLFDLLNRKVTSIARKGLPAGDHAIPVNLCGLGLAPGDYLYQLQVATRHGVQHQHKRMTTC